MHGASLDPPALGIKLKIEAQVLDIDLAIRRDLATRLGLKLVRARDDASPQDWPRMSQEGDEKSRQNGGSEVSHLRILHRPGHLGCYTDRAAQHFLCPFPLQFDALPSCLSLVDVKAHMHHRGFLMEVWRLRGGESVRYQDGTNLSLPRHADGVASDTMGSSSGQ